jgi:ribonuclease BN (tRNA processing enzyme)
MFAHVQDAFGAVLHLDATVAGGGRQADHTFKLVYSGDTRPSQQLALAGSGADLLVHEATFDDDRRVGC